MGTYRTKTTEERGFYFRFDMNPRITPSRYRSLKFLSYALITFLYISGGLLGCAGASIILVKPLLPLINHLTTDPHNRDIIENIFLGLIGFFGGATTWELSKKIVKFPDLD